MGQQEMFHYLSIYFWIIKESFWKSILSIMAAANKIWRRTPERMLLCHNSVMSGWTKSKELELFKHCLPLLQCGALLLVEGIHCLHTDTTHSAHLRFLSRVCCVFFLSTCLSGSGWSEENNPQYRYTH